jgi:hypothetical protein
MAVYLTYDNESLTDGYGAQTLRIIGIYSLAKMTRSKYIHSPIKETIEEFSHNVQNQSELDSLTDRVNEFFILPSDSAPKTFSKVATVKSLDLKYLIRILCRYTFSNKNILLRVLLPYPCIEKFPSINKIATRYIRRNNSELFDARFRHEIVVHARLGYGQKSEKTDRAAPRHLPLEYFVQVIQLMRWKFFKKMIGKHIIIHTDLAPKTTFWKPTPKALNEVISFGENVFAKSILVEGNDISPYFQALEGFSFEVRYCSDFFETFLDLACARYLIMSRSTFSYLAALFNEGTVIYPDSHGHVKLQSWKSTSEIGLTTTYKLIPG